MNDKETRKPYVKPEVLHDLELETRAGSVPEPCDNAFCLED